ncbi:copper chaperone PCu(A)C [Catenovulum sp. SM1970]|uniref:copper chaperone PCu(A)C n=1 Tax=Marinifaba aquimaris TaxID=2741323 RepID=UPI00157278D9|nr:copper chaperone PCu(A)C [Marinifaba aquimaris]NTS76664.1 copper chaperone PCu(A)C [Marinifaba aquimaris]
MNTSIKWSLALLFSVASFICQANLKVDDPQVRLLPPGVPNTAAYMQLTNTGNKVIRLIKASSSASAKVEFHQSYHLDGMAKMKQVDELVIKQGQTLSLESGGTHIMLINLAQPLKQGEKVALTLVDDNNQIYKVMATVKKGHGGHHHGHHGHHQHHH